MPKEIYLKVGIIVVNDDNEILLIKEKVSDDTKAALNIVKGTYDKENESITECAIRECNEEAGLNVDLLGILSIIHMESRGKLKIQYNFVARTNSKKTILPKDRGLHIQDENVMEHLWFTEDQIMELHTNDFVADYTLGIVKEWMSKKKIYPLDIIK